MRLNYLMLSAWMACAAILHPPAAQAAEPTPPADKPDFPATPSGQLARAFVDQINRAAPDDAALREFAGAHVAAATWNGMTSATCEQMMRRLREQSRGVELVKVLSASERSARLLLQSRAGGHRVGLEVVCDPADPARARWFGLHPVPAPDAPRPPSLPKERIDAAEIPAAIARHVGDTVALDRFSGVVLVARDDRVLLHRAWGLADAGRGITNRTDTRFGSGSVGKMFTGIAIAQLVEAGKLKFDDLLTAHLPDYPNPAAVTGVTLHHLLTHTAGLGDPFDSPLRTPAFKPRRQSDWFPLFADRPSGFKPGARHAYSNGGYLVLGATVEQASGRPFADYVCEHILRPAGMRHTGCLAVEDAATSIAAPHRRLMIEDPLGIEPRRVVAAPGFRREGSGMGEWQTTAEDLFRFARALRTHRLLSPAMTDRVIAGRVAAHGDRVKYGYGFYEMDVQGARAIGHSGGGGDSGIAAEVELLWDEGCTVVILSNYDLPETRRLAHDLLRFLRTQAE